MAESAESKSAKAKDMEINNEDHELLAEIMGHGGDGSELFGNDADVFLRNGSGSGETQAGNADGLALYPQATPAHRHEQMAMMNHGNSEMHSFLDDMFTNSSLGHGQPVTESNLTKNMMGNHYEQNLESDIASSLYNSRHPSVSMEHGTAGHPEMLFHQNDNSISSFSESFYGSSLDSSISEVSSINSFMSGNSFPAPLPHQIDENSILVNNNMSPSGFRDSIRPGSFLSTSLRAPSSMSRQMRNPSYNDSGIPMTVGSVPKNATSHMTPDEKLKRKREFHNAVERRRRELIKQKIKELSKLVPPSLLNYDADGNQIKSNRVTILDKSVEYLEYLLYVIDIQKRKREALQEKIAQLSSLSSRTTDDLGMGPRKMTNLPQRISSQATLKANTFNEEKIIDTRGIPDTRGISASQAHTDNPLEDFNHNHVDFNATHTDFNNNINDDLQQFLSGDLMEAEDNAKLMFNP